ncbi:MAG TPA: magnesium transporter [Sediminispirochaeta sp.]|nr:magnesium transporter [Sediminispirochaeta sp.]
MNPPIQETKLGIPVLLENGDFEELRRVCGESHPALVAEELETLDPQRLWDALKHLDPTLMADIFSHFDEGYQLQVVDFLNRREFAQLLAEMAPDDRADLFKHLSDEQRETVLPALAQAEREDIRRLSAYEEGTAGAVMTSDYATVLPGLTVGQAIEHLRDVAPDRETIYYAYVVDDQHRLLGFVSLKDLVTARRGEIIDTLVQKETIRCRVNDDQEEAAHLIQKYDLLALPVIDGQERLVGIITHDDAMDILTYEQTEDMEKLMAIAGGHEPISYIKTPVLNHFRNRFPWVVALAVIGLVSGFIVQSFETLLDQFVILAAFMPMLADTGGNTGSQAATLVVRALALDEIVSGDFFRILWKELRISLMLALLLGIIAYGRVLLYSGTSIDGPEYSIGLIGLAIALALGLQVVTSTLIGALLPLAAHKVKLDPALVASPAITTVVDISGLLIYFSTVKVVLGV